MLNQAEIRYADGMGVVRVMQKKLRRHVERVPRPLIDEALRLMALLNRRGAG